MDILASEKPVDNPIPAPGYRDYDICTGIEIAHKDQLSSRFLDMNSMPVKNNNKTLSSNRYRANFAAGLIKIPVKDV